MALYKYEVFLEKSQHEAFDQLSSPGAAAPYPGVYRCHACGHEIAIAAGHVLPPQNHRDPFILVVGGPPFRLLTDRITTLRLPLALRFSEGRNHEHDFNKVACRSDQMLRTTGLNLVIPTLPKTGKSGQAQLLINQKRSTEAWASHPPRFMGMTKSEMGHPPTTFT